MCFTFKKNNKQTKKPVNCFLQDDASAGIQSLQTSIVTKLCQNPGDRLHINAGENGDLPIFQSGHSRVVCLFKQETPEGVRWPLW